MVKLPSWFVVAVATSFVSTFCTATVAPGKAPPLASTTCPLIVARNSWALAPPAVPNSTTTARIARDDSTLFIRPPLQADVKDAVFVELYRLRFP